MSDIPSNEYLLKNKSSRFWLSCWCFHSTKRHGTQAQDSFSRYVTFSLKACLKASDRGILPELVMAVALQTVSWTPLQLNPKHNTDTGIQVLFSLFNNFEVKITSADQLESLDLLLMQFICNELSQAWLNRETNKCIFCANGEIPETPRFSWILL